MSVRNCHVIGCLEYLLPASGAWFLLILVLSVPLKFMGLTDVRLPGSSVSNGSLLSVVYTGIHVAIY